MRLTIVECGYCKKPFERASNEVRRSERKGLKSFCSKECQALGKTKPTKLISNVSCAYCGDSFYMSASKQKLSKSGLYFCCRKHKDSAQRIGGIREIMPPHYGTAESVRGYRRSAFDTYAHECNECKWDEYAEILEVHHIDHNRENNDVSNLRLLCPRCHDLHHYLTKTGKWGSKVIVVD